MMVSVFRTRHILKFLHLLVWQRKTLKFFRTSDRTIFPLNVSTQKSRSFFFLCNDWHGCGRLCLVRFSAIYWSWLILKVKSTQWMKKFCNQCGLNSDILSKRFDVSWQSRSSFRLTASIKKKGFVKIRSLHVANVTLCFILFFKCH